MKRFEDFIAELEAITAATVAEVERRQREKDG